ncbi:MAG: DEAD/DEAH box helicase, partial [Candidatus Zixiibacteriota bacterium]
MPIHKIFTGNPTLSDISLARQLGHRLWTENDLQLDFTGIERVTGEFATELCRTILEQRSAAVLHNALLTDTMQPAVQATFLPVIMAAFSGALPPTPGPDPDTDTAGADDTSDVSSGQIFNPLSALRNIQDAYLQYVYTFQKFTNPAIAEWVQEKIRTGTLLWRDPYIQLTRRFEPGDTFDALVRAGIIHPETPRYFTDAHGNPVRLYRHQSQAIKSILGGAKPEKDTPPTPNNTIIATGTGSGKSFCFGIPIVSECLRLRDRGVQGIKAIIIYPMNALGNSQYADFARRLHGSGLKIALYTGDTPYSPDEALLTYREATGRDQPYDCEIISREEIQQTPPDILMTNYVMLELLLTRFEDRRLFPVQHAGVLRFLVLDEVHTYTGKQGADVACLIRRLKQHTNTTGKLCCIGTSATISSDDPETGARLITRFAANLFGEEFSPNHVVGEMYRPTAGQGDGDLAATIEVTDEDIVAFDGSIEAIAALAEKLLGVRGSGLGGSEQPTTPA